MAKNQTQPDPENPEDQKPKKPKVLLDPNTGKPLRNQSPGVPDGPWVGKHTARDVDDPLYAENMRKEQDKRLKEDLADE